MAGARQIVNEKKPKALSAKKAKKPPKETAVARLRRLHPEIKDVWDELKVQSEKTLDFPLIDQPAALVGLTSWQAPSPACHTRALLQRLLPGG